MSLHFKKRHFMNVLFCNCNNSKSTETVLKSSRTRSIIRKKELNITGISAVLNPNHWRFTVLLGMRIVLCWRKNWSAGPGALMVQFLHPCNLQMIYIYTSKLQSDFQQLLANSNSIIFVIRWWQIQDHNITLEYWMVINFSQLGQFHLFMHRTCPLNFKEANMCLCVFVRATKNTKCHIQEQTHRYCMEETGNQQHENRIRVWENCYLLGLRQNLAAGYNTICWSSK
jgi:hypothetical protein